MNAFSNESRRNTFKYMYLCKVGSGLSQLISYGSLLNFQFIFLGMLCVRYRNNFFTKRGYFSCKVALLASFMTAIVTTFGIVFCLVRVDFFPVVKPYVLQRASALACLLLLAVILCAAKEIRRRIHLVGTWRESRLLSFVTILFLLGFVSIINLEVIRHESLQNIEFFQRIFLLYVLCIIVGVLLPLMFQRVIDSSLHARNKELTYLTTTHV